MDSLSSGIIFAAHHNGASLLLYNPIISLTMRSQPLIAPTSTSRLNASSPTYAKPLTEKQMEDYELKPAPGNPDRVRSSITARLKDGTRGQEPQKEPGQKRSHKTHEER